MNNTFDFNSKKYIILLVLICLVFAIFIIKAFDYLPDKDVVDSNNTEVENINIASNLNSSPVVSNETKSKPNQKSGVLYRSPETYQNDTNIEEIDAPDGIGEETFNDEQISNNNGNNISPDLKALQSIINAKNLASSGDMQSSLEEYKKALSITNENEVKAEAYEGISLLYAKNKKYETALSFAVKAYKLSPSLTRDFLIAKIYYSAGKTESAISRINEILKRGF